VKELAADPKEKMQSLFKMINFCVLEGLVINLGNYLVRKSAFTLKPYYLLLLLLTV